MDFEHFYSSQSISIIARVLMRWQVASLNERDDDYYYIKSWLRFKYIFINFLEVKH